MGKPKNKNLNNSDPSGGPGEYNALPAALKMINDKLDQQSELHKARHDELTRKLECALEENRVLKARLDKVEHVHLEMVEEICVLKEKVNDLYQDRIMNNIIVKNVPEATGMEDFYSLFKVLSNKIGVQPIKSFYIDAYRLGKKTDGRSRPIVYKLASNKYKLEIIKAKRKCKIFSNTMTSDNRAGETTLGSPDDEIYIDEHLTRDNMHLFMEARNLRRHGYKFIWSRNGKVFIKASESSHVTKLSGMSHLKYIVKNVMVKDVIANDENRKRRNISASTEHGSPDDPFKHLKFVSPTKKKMNLASGQEPMECVDHEPDHNMSV